MFKRMQRLTIKGKARYKILSQGILFIKSDVNLKLRLNIGGTAF